MENAMVAARVPVERKERVARKLAGMNSNVSEAINQLFDYIDTHNALPFPDESQSVPRTQRAAAASEWLNGLTRLPEGNAFQQLSDEEITQKRLQSRGFEA
ncbi:MAG: hypothetical protein Q4E12_06765 [Coriobacteriia bacterium]|nr:hypothetical protein [Coriobacteriia bacterium]